jgi:alpha-D-ribose 1-methylphosphonate 5-triphosphate synthase subunit PhnG
MTQPPKVAYQGADRTRVAIELSPSVSLLLDHVCEVTGANKSQVVLTALMDALPGLLERSDSLQKRSAALAQSLASKKR